MDTYAALFWIGFLVLIAMHATELQRNTQHATPRSRKGVPRRSALF